MDASRLSSQNLRRWVTRIRVVVAGVGVVVGVVVVVVVEDDDDAAAATAVAAVVAEALE